MAVSDFSPPESSSDVLQPLAGRRGHDVDAAFGQIGLVGEAHFALAAAEQRLEHLSEVRVDAFEGFLEAAARFGVEFLNGFLGVADGIEQILPLGVQELVALLRFLEFFERLRDSPGPALRCARGLPDSAARILPR